MKREEILDICQISRAAWISHEAQGKLPVPNKEEYSDSEALELIKYWRYAKVIRPWSSDFSKRELAKFLDIHLSTLNHQINLGNIPQPDKRFGMRRVYSHELANRIKATFDKWEYPWTRARKVGLFTLKEASEKIGCSDVWLTKRMKPKHEFEGRLFYSARDIRDIRRERGSQNSVSENSDSQT